MEKNFKLSSIENMFSKSIKVILSVRLSGDNGRELDLFRAGTGFSFDGVCTINKSKLGQKQTARIDTCSKRCA